MDLSFTEEQEMLRKTARDFLATECPKTLVKQMAEDEKGYTPELWNKIEELGWLGLIFPKEYGGLGLGFMDLVVLLEEMGRAQLPGPYFSTVLLGGLPILEGGSVEQKKEFLPKIARGEMLITLALTEPTSQYEAASIGVKAMPDQDNYLISGIKLYVENAHIADFLIYAARTSEEATTKDGITLFLVDAKSAGVSTTLLKTISGEKQCEVIFDQVRVPKKNMLGELDQGWKVVERVLHKATVALCAEMVGGAQQVLEMSVDYAKERVQFGRPIGSFQAIQHHCSNMAMDVDSSRYITYKAASKIADELPCTMEVAMAKGWVSDAYRRVTALGQQVHGGIGYTLEHDMPLYFKHAKVAETTFGDTDFHRERVAQELGL